MRLLAHRSEDLATPWKSQDGHLGRSEATMFPRAVLSNSDRAFREVRTVISLAYREGEAFCEPAWDLISIIHRLSFNSEIKRFVQLNTSSSFARLRVKRLPLKLHREDAFPKQTFAFARRNILPCETHH
jgi:hypothetical protein